MTDVTARPKRLWVGRYHLQARLGSGGQGTVYRAHDQMLDRPVAVKFPKLSKLADPKAADRFRREAQALAKLRHPNILAVHELGEFKHQMFLVTDLAVGKTLSEAIRERQWSPDEAAALVEKLARALHHIHQAGLIHRDIKPSNIFIEEGGNPLVMDFGLVREIGGRTDATRTGDLLGTPGFVSPEQASGPGELDARTDVYSLGVIFYMLLARRLPFVGTPLQIIRQSAERDAKPPGRYRPNIPSEIQAICLQAIARDPARRFATAEAFADALAQKKPAAAFHRAVRRSELWHGAIDLLSTHWPTVAGAALVIVAGVWFALRMSGGSRSNGKDDPGIKTDDGIVVRKDAPQRDRNGRPPVTDAVPKVKPQEKDKTKTQPPDRKGEPPVVIDRPGLTAGEWLEDVRVGAALYKARWRWIGPKESFERAPDKSELYAAGELYLVFVAGNRGGIAAAETIPLFWKRAGGHWYCDPVTFFGIVLRKVIDECSPADAAALNADLFAEARRLGAKTLLHFEQDRPGEPLAAEGRLFLQHPTLAGGRAQSDAPWKIRFTEDFPAPVDRHPTATVKEADEMDPFLEKLVNGLLVKADAQWSDSAGRMRAIRMVSALAAAEGFGKAAAFKAGESQRRLLQWAGQVIEDSPPAACDRMLTETRLGRLLRPARMGDPVGWEAFGERIRAVVERWRMSDKAGEPAAADKLEKWLKTAGT